MISSRKKNFSLRFSMVHFAKIHGIKPAARKFDTTPKTVRKWLDRFQSDGNQGLYDRSRRPRHSPNKTPKAIEDLAIAQRRKTPGFGARRLIEEFELPLSHNAANRIFKEQNLLQKRKKKYQTKNDLRAVKAAYKPFTRFQMDTKHLKDLPSYWAQMKTLGLPAYQYTIREVSTGAQFLTYSQELSKTYATAAIKRFLEHLDRFKIDTKEVVIQTDLGSEFDGGTEDYREDGFHLTIEGPKFEATHKYNPPSCPNANADVESVHATIEGEFYEAETFVSKEDFMRKAATYQFWYNVKRKNSSRGWRSPLDILADKDYCIDPRIFLHHPVNLEYFIDHPGGYHVPRLPDSKER